MPPGTRSHCSNAALQQVHESADRLNGQMHTSPQRPCPLLRRKMYASIKMAMVWLKLIIDVAFPPHSVVSMPALSPTMTSGNIGAWQKKPGDTIAPGDVLVEIETDKAQMDFEFQEEGLLAKILKDSGEKDVAVGNVGHSPIPAPQLG